MPFACHEAVVDECINQPSHRSRRHLDRLSKDALWDRTAIMTISQPPPFIYFQF